MHLCAGTLSAARTTFRTKLTLASFLLPFKPARGSSAAATAAAAPPFVSSSLSSSCRGSWTSFDLRRLLGTRTAATTTLAASCLLTTVACGFWTSSLGTCNYFAASAAAAYNSPIFSPSYRHSRMRRMVSTCAISRTSDGTVTVSPKNESDQSALVVFCHGLGDTSEGFADVAEQLSTQLPWCKFVLPTAPVNPVTLNGGMRMNSWYDIVGLDERSNERCDGIEQSRSRIESILQKEHDDLGLPYSRMVLAGFSQGGALALFTGLQLGGGESAKAEKKVAGIVVLSGYLPCAKQFRISPGLEGTPIFHGHGTQDLIVQLRMAQKTSELLKEWGVSGYKLRTYPIGHTVSMDEIGHVRDFLLSTIPDDPSCRVKLKDPSSMSVKELKLAIQRAGLAHRAAGFCEKAEFVKLLQEHRNKL